MPNSTCHLSGIVRIIYPGPYLPFKWYRACYLLGQYLQFLRYRAHSVYGTVPAIFAVPWPFCIQHGTSNFAVPCLFFIRDGTCHFCGTVPILYTGRYLPFKWYRACQGTPSFPNPTADG